MRSFLTTALVVLATIPLTVRADVTIRYRGEMTSPIGGAPGRITAYVVRMKGNKGITVDDSETTIVDFGRQQVTVIDTVRRKYATVSAAEYGKWTEERMPDAAPETADMEGMLKSMKAVCETKKSGATETIQGVLAEEREITCTTTMKAPEGTQDQAAAFLTGMSMKSVMRIWSAAPSERLRVPGLWQLSGFDAWEKYFENPMGSLGEMAPEGMKPMMEALEKDQSTMLRSSMEMSMKMPMAGAAESEMPVFKASNEVVGLSTELLDDSLFDVPGDCSAEPFEDLMKGITDAEMESEKAEEAKASAQAAPLRAIPENVKAFIPLLYPLTQTEPVTPVDAGGEKVQGVVQLLVTVGAKGNVEELEVLTGPEALRKSATDSVRQWSFRPVIRDGAPVAAYTEVRVDFTDYSKGPPPASSFQYTPEMEAADDRLEQLRKSLPRSPEQEFADVEQDAGGGDKERRYDRLGELALKAAELGANDKAKAYATELLMGAQADAGGWNYGNAVHKGHTVLGLVALRSDDVATARSQLLESGKTPGSPQLNSFGPNMTLANELLKRGERDVVVEYFDMCRKFWKLGGGKLDSWSKMVRNGEMPAFGANLVY